jgi:hypothetical protein
VTRAAAAIALAIAAGCGGGASSSSSDLVKDVRGYNNGLRWRDFPASALRVRPSLRAAFLDSREKVDDDLRIADWEMTRLEYEDRHQRAVVQVEYTWLLDSRGIVHTTVARQWWARHGERWLIEREERLRGDPMPGLAEPAGKAGTDPTRQRGESTVNDHPGEK